MKPKIQINIIELNNKSRKGTYLRIKERNKKTTTYYKYDPNTPIDYYIQYYKQQQKTENKRKTPKITTHLNTYKETIQKEITKGKKDKTITTQAQKYLKKITKKYGGKTIDKIIKKGIQDITLADAFKATPQTIYRANLNLISGLVLDKDIRNQMAQEENMKKISQRLEQRITLIGEKGKELWTFNKIGITTQQTVTEMQRIFRKSEEIKKTKGNTKIATLTANGYNKPEAKNEGKIQRIQITTILRKAK